eukprot:7192823-Alexandrium_andersonii.AAC.1
MNIERAHAAPNCPKAAPVTTCTGSTKLPRLLQGVPHHHCVCSERDDSTLNFATQPGNAGATVSMTSGSTSEISVGLGKISTM